MAVAKGKQSSEVAERKLYVGVAAVKVLAVNPNKKELEKLFDRELEKDPEYLGEVDVNGTKYKNVRINFIVKTDAEKNNGIDLTTNHTFFLQKRYRQGSQSGKYQVIDKYGQTAWAVKDTDFKVENGKFTPIQVPQYSNGPANIDLDYRPAFVGEEELTLFIKNLLNIPNIRVYSKATDSWGKNTKVDEADCEVRLDQIENYFKGDFKELAEIISYQPDNLVKIEMGVRTTDDNRQYQTTYTQLCFKNGVTDYAKLDKEIQERKNAGAFANTELPVCELREYQVDPTTLNPTLEQAAAAASLGEDTPW